MRSPFECLAAFLVDRAELVRTISELRDELVEAHLEVNKQRIVAATEAALVDFKVRECRDLQRENERLRARLCEVDR